MRRETFKMVFPFLMLFMTIVSQGMSKNSEDILNSSTPTLQSSSLEFKPLNKGSKTKAPSPSNSTSSYKSVQQRTRERRDKITEDQSQAVEKELN